MAKKISSHSHIPYALGEIYWNTFPDGSLDAIIGGREKGYIPDYIARMVRNRDIVFLASFDSLEEIQKQMLVIYQLARYEAHSFKIIIPYFPGTMDREDRAGRVVTAVGYMDQLGNIPLQRGPATVIMFDLHVPHELFYLGHHARCRPLSTMPLFLQRRMYLDCQEYSLSVAFPDEGSYKRFAHLLPPFPQIICYKRRNNLDCKVTIVEGDPRDKHVVIVDDIIFSGETLLTCKNALMEQGALAVSIFAPHGVFPQESWKKFIDCGFAHVWITDSCPRSAKAVEWKKPFEILSLAPLIAHEITH